MLLIGSRHAALLVQPQYVLDQLRRTLHVFGNDVKGLDGVMLVGILQLRREVIPQLAEGLVGPGHKYRRW